MSELIEPEPDEFDLVWDRTEYTASTPSGSVTVSMTGDRGIRVRVDPTWYARASRSDITSALAQAARLTFVTRTRAYYETSSTVAGMEIRPVRTYVSARQEEYFSRLAELTVQGSSPGGEVTVMMTGLQDYAVTVDVGVLDRVDATGFASLCEAAAASLLAAHTEAWQRTHFDVYTRPKLEKAGLL